MNTIVTIATQIQLSENMRIRFSHQRFNVILSGFTVDQSENEAPKIYIWLGLRSLFLSSHQITYGRYFGLWILSVQTWCRVQTCVDREMQFSYKKCAVFVPIYINIAPFAPPETYSNNNYHEHLRRLHSVFDAVRLQRHGRRFRRDGHQTDIEPLHGRLDGAV